ncbi:MAG TPA: RNA 2',3'-cyclic phosphodiesterase [Planctomycetota bacterium]|nr:RNA 2',3'-cyclic phosphodiesterase [Planctomycetota bacterium]
MSKLIRAFFAAEIDDRLRRELAAVMSDLQRIDAAVRWVAPENLHWTVKFLGDVPMTSTGEIAGAAKEALEEHAPFAGTVTGVAAFPDARRMRLVAARMEDGGQLGAIRDIVEDYMEDFGVPPDGRAFKAHLTMGRVKGSRGIGELAEALKAYEGKGFGECHVEEVVLFMSELSRGGPTYTPLARIPLGGGATP